MALNVTLKFKFTGQQDLLCETSVNYARVGHASLSTVACAQGKFRRQCHLCRLLG